MKVNIPLKSTSALTPSQYRPFLKGGWNKRRLNPLFKKYGESRGYRIYMDFGDLKLNENAEPPAELSAYFKSKGVDVEDYHRGIGIDKHRRPIRLGKVVAKDPKMKKLYDHDVKRFGYKLKNLIVVISRHPYDIAGMSTNRGWTSCMDLDEGSNISYIPEEIKAGTLVAYLLKNNDRDITRPVARCLIKPYKSGKKTVYLADPAYPKEITQLQPFIQKWADKYINKGHVGLAELNKHSYADSPRLRALGDISDPKVVKLLNEDVYYAMEVVSENPDAISLISGEVFGQVLQTALMQGVSEKVLIEKEKDIRNSDYTALRHIFVYKPEMTERFFPPDDPNARSSVLTLTKATNFPFPLLVDYTNAIKNESERKKFVNQMIPILSSSDLVSYCSVFKELVDFQIIDMRRIDATSASQLRELFLGNAKETKEFDQLGIIRSVGLAIGESEVPDMIKFLNDDSNSEAAIDAIQQVYPTDVLNNFLGNLLGLRRFTPYKVVLACPDFMFKLIRRDPKFIMALSSADVGAMTPGEANSLLAITVEATKKMPDSVKYLRPTLGDAGNAFIARVYQSIGVENAIKSVFWSRLHVDIKLKNILANHTIPDYLPSEGIKSRSGDELKLNEALAGVDVPPKYVQLLNQLSAQPTE